MNRSEIGRALRIGDALPISNTTARYTLRGLAVICVTGVFLFLLQQRLASLDGDAVMQAFSAVPSGNWLLALAATALSFWAVGQYDASLHRHLNMKTHPKNARRAGMAAIALGQTLGLGVLTGALVRWRMVAGLSLIDATKLSAAVTISFLFGWAVITGAVLLALPAAPLKTLAWAACALGLLVAALCLIQPRWHLFGYKIALPNLFTLCHILAFALVDTFAAAAALWLLCPPELALPFAALLPAYLLALGAGLVSGTPGGVGAFEMTLLAALPMVDEPALIAGVLAFRLAYYAIPAILAALCLLTQRRHTKRATKPRRIMAYSNAPAEADLAAQNHIKLFDISPYSQALMGETPHALILLLDPFGAPNHAQSLGALTALAKARTRVACLYKCGPALAAAARTAGWYILPIAGEAWLNPATFSLNGPDKSALRRKLRKAEKSGLTLRELTPDDLPSTACINREWASNNGGERGFSMGRFAPAHIAAQRVFGAFDGGKLCAFISFHHNSHQWALDLMRHRTGTPDGINYALIVLALQAAAAQGITRLSLAAAPRLPEIPAALRRIIPLPTGLCQFKASFAPRWQPLYIAAPNRLSLALAAAEIYREIHAPPPLVDTAAQPALQGAPQGARAQNGIAYRAQPWQMGGN